MSHIIAPSVLAANFLNLEKDIKMVNQSDASWFHIDVMDGRFVPNISFGMGIIKQMKNIATKPFDVHLMIVEPEKYLEDFRKAGANILTVHYEAVNHLHRTLNAIRELDMKAGVALNPHTPVSVLEDVITEIDLVCIMSVNPGFGGQKFIENTYDKVRALKELCHRKNVQIHIEIDGGVNKNNAPKLVQAGADVLVAGSSVFKADHPLEMITSLSKPIEENLKV
jgi:ribulose-phosphate 3-epimerase